MSGSFAPDTDGVWDPDSLLIGRGVLYMAEVDSTSGLPGAFRDVGNCTSFAFNQTTEELKHQSSREGLKTTDKKVVLSQELGFTFTLDGFNQENIGLIFSGLASTYTNPAIAGVAETVALYTNVVRGQWYELRKSTGERIYGVDAADLLLEKDGSPDVTLVDGTDFEYNQDFGMFRILSTSIVITDDAQSVNMTVTADGAAPVVNQMAFLQNANVQYALKIIGVNPADNNKTYELHIHSTTLTPNGDVNMISNEFATMTFQGVAEESAATAHAAHPYGFFREHAES